MGSISREIYRFNINNNMREEDRNINEAYLNQDAIGLSQQRDPNGNLKFRPQYDGNNSNYKNFKGMNDGAKMSDARMPSTPDLSSDEEKEVAGYIYKSETSDITPENPEVVVVGIGRYRLDALESDIRSSLKELANESTSNIISKMTGNFAVLPHKIKALDQVLKKMDTSAYKRKITLAKRKR
jgi:hypothetical protein